MTTPRHAPGTFCWFECGTTDAAAAKRYYTELFGWSATDVPMPGDAGGQYTLLQIGGDDVAGLYQMSGPQFEGVPSHWATYVNVESTDETAKRATTLGGRIVAPPMDVPGVGRIAVVQDPTGATISLFEPGDHPGQGASSPFGWSELATRDTEAAKAFYTELFRWRAKVDDKGPMRYTEFQAGGRSIGGMMEMTEAHGDAPPHWLPYVMVQGCNASVDKARGLGAKIVAAPRDIPDVGRFSVFQDPTGAFLAIIQMKGRHA
jgi:predicted enzyme related to lactoylglutathione lyase